MRMATRSLGQVVLESPLGNPDRWGEGLRENGIFQTSEKAGALFSETQSNLSEITLSKQQNFVNYPKEKGPRELL
jgi:hypothetical protein